MSNELWSMIRDGAPRGWTTAMRLVAMAIADKAPDPCDLPPGEMPRSAISIEGHYGIDGQWRPGITQLTSMPARQVARTLERLAAAGYEMRAPDGSFIVPVLPPRPTTPGGH